MRLAHVHSCLHSWERRDPSHFIKAENGTPGVFDSYLDSGATRCVTLSKSPSILKALFLRG